MVGLYSTQFPLKLLGTQPLKTQIMMEKLVEHTKIISFKEIQQNSVHYLFHSFHLKCFPYSVWWCNFYLPNFTERTCSCFKLVVLLFSSFLLVKRHIRPSSKLLMPILFPPANFFHVFQEYMWKIDFFFFLDTREQERISTKTSNQTSCCFSL